MSLPPSLYPSGPPPPPGLQKKVLYNSSVPVAAPALRSVDNGLESALRALDISNSTNSEMRKCESFIPQAPTNLTKTKALLSIMKSKAGDSVNQKTQEDVNLPPAVVDAPPVPADLPKKSGHRNTKSQIGQLQIRFRNGKTSADVVMRDGFCLRPSASVFVHWKLPQSFSIDGDKNICIGLFRYGMPLNTASIVSKSIMVNKAQFVVDPQTGEKYIRGFIAFFAPKTAGQFVFRLFDQSNRETSMDTLATSSTFSVVLADLEIGDALRQLADVWIDGPATKAISLFGQLIRAIVSIADPSPILSEFNSNIEHLLVAIEQSMELLDEESSQEKQLEDPNSSDFDEEKHKKLLSARRTQVDAHDAIIALIQHQLAWNLVSERLKTVILKLQSCYCTISKRFFRTKPDMALSLLQSLGFIPSVSTNGQHFSRLTDFFSVSLQNNLMAIMPDSSFESTRAAICARINSLLRNVPDLPHGSRVELFGSSANGFGDTTADLDFCLFLGTEQLFSNLDKARLLELIGETLSKSGATNINIRSTARVPIVEFHDVLSGFDCDICLKNSLAVKNTQLLRVYGAIDPRVRQLAFAVKKWAKARHCNSPQSGTLSSYGHVLSVIHFLQNRPIPILPYLQSLPRHWPMPADSNRDCYHIELHPFDDVPCNTYFLIPNNQQLMMLQALAQKNRESIGELLLEFFRYFAWNFDFKERVVCIRAQPKSMQKNDKCEHDGWFPSDVLSIEDPFETWYDVAHVIRGPQMRYMRGEYLRAFTILSRSLEASAPVSDSLPTTVDINDICPLLWQEASIPDFERKSQERDA